jgi:hypothetical protein
LPNGEFIGSDILGAHFVHNFTINSLMNLYDKSLNEQVVRQVFSDDIATKYSIRYSFLKLRRIELFGKRKGTVVTLSVVLTGYV